MLGNTRSSTLSAGAARRPGSERPWAGRGRQAPMCVARVRRAHRHLMPTSRQAARHRVRQPRDASVRPGVTSVRRYVQHTQGLHTIGPPHMSVIGSTAAASARRVAGRSSRFPPRVQRSSPSSLYLNALDNPFVYDDFRLIVENTSILNVSDLQTVIVRDITRPLVNLSYAIDTHAVGPAAVRLSRDEPAAPRRSTSCSFSGWHCWPPKTAGGRPASVSGVSASPTMIAAATAMLFAMHPMMTQAVGYISGRSEVAYSAFFLLAFLAGRRWMLGGGKRWWMACIGLWVTAHADEGIGRDAALRAARLRLVRAGRGSGRAAAPFAAAGTAHAGCDNRGGSRPDRPAHDGGVSRTRRVPTGASRWSRWMPSGDTSGCSSFRVASRSFMPCRSSTACSRCARSAASGDWRCSCVADMGLRRCTA